MRQSVSLRVRTSREMGAHERREDNSMSTSVIVFPCKQPRRPAANHLSQSASDLSECGGWSISLTNVVSNVRSRL